MNLEHQRQGTRLAFAIDASSSAPVEQIEVLVNGKVVWSGGRLEGSRQYMGTVDVPAGGWIAARARGGASVWPFQDSYMFAHTAPVWLGERGSRDPEAARIAASDLLRWMDVADARLVTGYEGAAVPQLRARFAEGRARLTELAR